MQVWLAADPAFFHETGQSSRQIIELLVALPAHRTYRARA